MRPMPCWPPMPPAIRASPVRYVDHRTHVLASEGSRDDAGLQPVYDLDLSRKPSGEHHLDDPPLHDEVVEVALDQLLGADLWDELGARVLLWVVGVEAVSILYIDHRAAPEYLGNQVHAGVRPVLRDAPDSWWRLPPVVRRHPGDDDRRAGGEVHGQLVELLLRDADGVVLSHQGRDHQRVLLRDAGPENGE